MNVSPVISRLMQVRTTVRRRLIAYGVCAVAAGSISAFLLVITLDWLLWLPAVLRMLAVTGFILGFVAALMHWIIRPMQASLTLEEIAARLESHFESLQDRLTSTVNFLEQGHNSSPAMMKQVVRNTERLIQALPLESALSLRPFIHRSILLGVGMLTLMVVMLAAPNWVSTGLNRYVHPWGDVDWPRTVEIRPITEQLKAAVGESVTVRMELVKGLSDTRRGIVCLRDSKGEVIRLVMQRDSDHTFYATIAAVTTDLHYWFESGDDTTKRHASLIQVVRRPQVVEAMVEIIPPPYASNRPTRIEDLASGPVDAPIGGRAIIHLKASKPIPANTTVREIGLRLSTGELIPLRRDDADQTALSVELEIQTNRRFRVELRDHENFENRGSHEYALMAIPDAPPHIIVPEPKAVLELTSDGWVSLLIKVEDDFGLNALELDVERIGAGSHAVSLTELLEVEELPERISATVRYRWDLQPLELLPGDVLVYHVVATDNFVSPDRVGQVGRSSPMRITIISDVEFENRVREDLTRLETQIRSLWLQQTDVLDQSVMLQTDPMTESTPEMIKHDDAGALASRQARLIRRTRELAKRFDRLATRAEQNEASRTQRLQRIRAIYNTLRRTAAKPMTQAGRALSDAQEQPDRQAFEKQLQTAVNEEHQATRALQELLTEMAQWGSFQELVTKTRDLHDRQNRLRIQTAKLGQTMIGQSADQLDPQQLSALTSIARQQEQLDTDAQRLLQHMKKLSAQGNAEQSSDTDAIDAAVRSASANDLSRNMAQAIQAIENNHTAAANVAQKNVEEALRKMVNALKERDNRALAELRKELENAEALVSDLLEHQEAIQETTSHINQQGDQNNQLSNLSRQQRTLARNTKLVSGDLKRIKRAGVAAAPLMQSVKPMKRAQLYLRESNAVDAVSNQDEAIVLLNEALDRLSDAANQAANEAVRRSLEQIKEDLTAIRDAQEILNLGITKLQEAIQKRGKISRAESRKATQLARAQGEVRAQLDEHLPDFEQVVVFRWAVDRVMLWMDESQQRIFNRKIDTPLVKKTNRIVRELDKLIGAIEETLALPTDTNFIESQSAGGEGSGPSSQQKPIPTVAELLVLKAMQSDINDRTDDINEVWAGQQADEKQLQTLTTIGEDQQEVKKLTEMVLEHANSR